MPLVSNIVRESIDTTNSTSNSKMILLERSACFFISNLLYLLLLLLLLLLLNSVPFSILFIVSKSNLLVAMSEKSEHTPKITEGENIRKQRINQKQLKSTTDRTLESKRRACVCVCLYVLCTY